MVKKVKENLDREKNLWYNNYHTYPLGSPIMIKDANGNTVKEYDYYAFGGIRSESGSFSNTHKFTGKELDESGLYYFGARYMDNAIGRFITPDPKSNLSGLRLNDPQSLNPYVYCRNNPLILVDPDGRTWRYVGSNEPIKTEQELIYLALLTVWLAERGKKPTLPYYFDPSSTEYDLTPRGPGESWFRYGPRGKTQKGRPYQLILAKGWGVGDIPIEKARLIVIGKDDAGQDIIEIEYGGSVIEGTKIKKTKMVSQFQGTQEDLNKLLSTENLEVVKEDGEYKIREICAEEIRR